MRLRFTLTRMLAIIAASLAMVAVSCAPQGTQTNTNTGNANASQAVEKKSGLPEGAEPMGAAAPGFYKAGPTGNVSLKFTSPMDGDVIEGNSVAPTFTITGYPIYKDDERNKGQHIHVILDNEPYEADYNPNQPFSPDKFKDLKDGFHTLRAFPSREWHESIKQPDGADFDFVVFYVKSKSTKAEVDKSAPLLTYSRPKGEYRWEEDPRGVMLDFYVANANIGPNDYKVQYKLDDRPPVVLTRWEPVWWKWEELTPGDHKVTLTLLDKTNKPVAFNAGGTNYNSTERAFKILGRGEAPSSGAANHNASNSNRH